MLRIKVRDVKIRKAGFTLCPVARLEQVNEETVLKILFAIYKQIGALDEEKEIVEEKESFYFEEIIDQDKIEKSIIESAFEDKLLEEVENQGYILTSKMIGLLEKAAKLQDRFSKSNNFYERLCGNISDLLNDN